MTSPDDLDEDRRQRRRIPELAIGLVLVFVGALASLWLFTSFSKTVDIVQTARSVRRGEIITIDHVQVFSMDADSAQPFVGRHEAKDVIGKVAAIDLALGTPLARSMIEQQPQLLPGEALTSVALEPGQFPPHLATGDVVAVALVPDVVMANVEPPRLFDGSVTVWSIAQPEGLFGTAIVTLRTTPELAVQIAGSGAVHLAVVKQ